MKPVGSHYLAHLVDLSIILAVVGMLAYAIKCGVIKAKRIPNRGRYLLFFGMTLAVIVHLTDLLPWLLLPSSHIELETEFLHGILPDWLYWLLIRTAHATIIIGMWLAIAQRIHDEKVFEATKETAKAAIEFEVQSEARFRDLLETMSNSVSCFTFDPPMSVSLSINEQAERSHDAVLTECNEVFARDIEAESASSIIGKKLGTLDSTIDVETHYQFFKAFIQSNYRLTDYQLNYKTRDAQDRAIKINVTGIVVDGFLHRMWRVQTDVLHHNQTIAALDRRHEFQKLIAGVSSRLIMATIEQADDVLQKSVQQICEFVGADRTALFWLDPSRETIHLLYSWSAADIPLMPAISMAEYPKCAEQLLRSEIVHIDDVDQLPDEWNIDRQELAGQGIRSFLALPLVADGEAVGTSTYANFCTNKKFSDQDIEDLSAFSNLFANFILRLKSRRALDDALISLKKATDRLDAENVYLRQEIELTIGFDEIVGASDSLLRCLRMVEKVAHTRAPVLITGETGTGKELIARAIHDHSDRHDRPLVKVNCAALPANLIESELFGYEKGAFTGADKSRRGRFDLANNSTIFLDEVGDIPLELQSKLLRVLQEGEFERLGGDATIKVDVRIIAATNRDIEAAAHEGQFRSDLLYRINTFPIEVPPLRERNDDIRLLTEHFVRLHSQQFGRDVCEISARMMEQLHAYSWPGNVRELEGVVQRALISSTGPVLDLAVPLIVRSGAFDDGMPRIVGTTISGLQTVERQHILTVLNDTSWKISGDSGAAAILGIPPSTLRSKMKKLSIVRPR